MAATAPEGRVIIAVKSSKKYRGIVVVESTAEKMRLRVLGRLLLEKIERGKLSERPRLVLPPLTSPSS